MMTLEQFRATGVGCDDLGAALEDGYWDYRSVPARGRLYLGDLWIERRPEAGWPNGAEGEWFLLIGNQDWLTDDLASLERELYDFAVDAGYCDDEEGSPWDC